MQEEQPQVIIQKQKGLNLPTAIVLAGVFIAGAIFMTSGDAPTFRDQQVAQAQQAQSNGKLDLLSPVTEKDFIRGDVNAPVTIVEYSDFQCPYCGVYHPNLQRIIEEYDGQVRWVYRHLPFFNPEAALASQCAGIVGGNDIFWEFADILFDNHSSLNMDFYLGQIQELGLSVDDFNACLANEAVAEDMQQTMTEARRLAGFNSTPTTLLIDAEGNRYDFPGALPYEEVKNIIETVVR